jgi:hypothetical protein
MAEASAGQPELPDACQRFVGHILLVVPAIEPRARLPADGQRTRHPYPAQRAAVRRRDLRRLGLRREHAARGDREEHQPGSSGRRQVQRVALRSVARERRGPAARPRRPGTPARARFDYTVDGPRHRLVVLATRTRRAFYHVTHPSPPKAGQRLARRHVSRPARCGRAEVPPHAGYRPDAPPRASTGAAGSSARTRPPTLAPTGSARRRRRNTVPASAGGEGSSGLRFGLVELLT